MLNPAEIKRLQRLRDDEKFRRDQGLFIVEGDKAVLEFVEAGRFSGALYATGEWSGWKRGPAAKDEPFVLHETTTAEMERISHLPSPSPVLAVFARPSPELLDLATLNRGVALALDRVQDPGNVGAILRVADWYDFGPVLLGDGCADPFSQKVVNASKGSLARTAIHRVDLPAILAAAGVPVLGCDLEGDSVHTLVAPPAAIVVIGSEGRGLSPAVRATVTRRITIPVFGRAESLNAALAAAIVCDNLRRSLG